MSLALKLFLIGFDRFTVYQTTGETKEQCNGCRINSYGFIERIGLQQFCPPREYSSPLSV
jgi:hypothetical protein